MPGKEKPDADAPVDTAAPTAPAPSAEKRTPDEWAQALGYILPGDPRLPQSPPHPKWEHAAADKLYGWSEHAYHFQGADRAFKVTEAVYREALDTAGRFPTVAPVDAALPFSQRARFVGFVPAARNQENG